MKHLKTFEKLNDNEIFDAIILDDFNKVKKLIESGIDINCVDEQNCTPLYYSIIFDRNEISKELIKAGANVNSIYFNNNNSTLLILAVTSKIFNIHIFNELINANAKINTQNYLKNTPLISAAVYNRFLIVKKLIKAGADWNIKDDDNKGFLDYLNDKNKKETIELYPEKYEEYLIKKNVEKYNL